MAYITEMQESRSITYNSKSASETRKYHCFDYTESSDALAAVIAYAPQRTIVGHYQCVLPEFTVTPVFSDPQKTYYSVDVVWNTPDQAEGGSGSGEDATEPKEPEDETSFSFQFTSITDVKVNTNNCTTYTASKINGKTGVTDTINQLSPESEPQGVEYNRPIITITAKTVIHRNMATNVWFKNRFAQIWTLNEETWRGLPANSVAFSGMNGTHRSDGHWDITYTFEHRPDTAGEVFKMYNDLSGAATVQVQSLDGWDYIWAQHMTTTIDNDVNDDRTTQRKLSAVHIVHDIYKTSDFSTLGMVGV